MQLLFGLLLHILKQLS